MYETLLWLHSYLRWLALALVVLAMLTGFQGWGGNKVWTKKSRLIGVFFVASLDLQFLIGLLLYFVASPITQAAMAAPAAAMKDPQLRFWLVEHAPVMLIALAVAHIGNARAKRAKDDKTKHRRLAVSAAITLLLILVAIPWPGRSAGRPLFR